MLVAILHGGARVASKIRVSPTPAVSEDATTARHEE